MATTPLAPTVLSILSWFKEKRSSGFTTVEEAAEQFGVSTEQMRRNLQALQRYECVKRCGNGHADWVITELGLVRLASGEFAANGDFLSPFDSRRTAPAAVSPVASRLEVLPATTAADRDILDRWAHSG